MGSKGYDLDLLKGIFDSIDVDNKRLVINLIEGMSLGEAIVDQFDKGDAKIVNVVDDVVESGADYFKGDDIFKKKSSKDNKAVVVKSTKKKSKKSEGTYVYKKKNYSSLEEVAEKLDLSYTMLKGRIDSGMDIVSAIEKPRASSGIRDPIVVTFNGTEYPSMNQLAKKYEVSTTRLHYYSIKKGMGIDGAMRKLGVKVLESSDV